MGRSAPPTLRLAGRPSTAMRRRVKEWVCPDVLDLLGPDGEAIARFSARGATAEAIEREARAHHRERNQTA